LAHTSKLTICGPSTGRSQYKLIRFSQ
jgi:hypothetical protein